MTKFQTGNENGVENLLEENIAKMTDSTSMGTIKDEVDNNDYWLKRWLNKKVGNFDQLEANKFLIKYFLDYNLEPNAVCFVPLCGKSIDMVYLLGQGINVIGVELSEEAVKLFFHGTGIEYNVKQTKNNHKLYYADNIKIIVADIFEIELYDIDSDINFWYDRGAYIALPLELRKKYADKIKSLCNGKTGFLFITSEHNGNKDKPAYSIAQKEMDDHFKGVINFTHVERYKRLDIPESKIKEGRTIQFYNIYQANVLK